jgi:hypothetical protein
MKCSKVLKNNLNPFHITGFTQSDGCFHIDIYKSSSSKLKLIVTPKFILTQHKDSVNILNHVKNYFDGGHIVSNRESCNYVINSLPVIRNKVIPHFDKYPLQSDKLKSYIYFKEIVRLISNKDHLNVDGLARIINIAFSMNRASSRNEARKMELLNLIGYLYSEENIYSSNNLISTSIPSSPLDPFYVSGLVDGDGSFNISFRSNGRISPAFTIIQDANSADLLYKVKDFFGCGSIYEINEDTVRYNVSNLKDLIDIIIPHFNQYPLYTVKSGHFKIFSEVCNLLKAKEHKNDSGLKRITDLALNMNRGGKYRKLNRN